MQEDIFQNEYMKVTDENETLKIWNYTGPHKEKFYNYRGYITNLNDELICPSFGHTEEILSSDVKRLGELDTNNYKWFYSSEGTLCRIFCNEDEWYISTHKKLSAFASRWSCKYSFGELFVNCLNSLYPDAEENAFEWFCSSLKKDEVYYFLLRCNSQNRIICNVTNLKDFERCLYIGKFSNGKYSLNTGNDDVELLNKFSKSVEVSLDEGKSIVERSEEVDPFVYQGLIGFNTTQENGIHVIKLLNSEYKNWMTVRGNNPNLRFRYLEIRRNPEMVEKLYNLYPRYSDMFDDFEEIIFKLARKIYSAYIDRYIKNKYITLPKEEYILLKRCHDWFLKDKANNKIFARKVLEFLNEETPFNLYKMIKRHQNVQREAINFLDGEKEKHFFKGLEQTMLNEEANGISLVENEASN